MSYRWCLCVWKWKNGGRTTDLFVYVCACVRVKREALKAAVYYSLCPSYCPYCCVSLIWQIWDIWLNISVISAQWKPTSSGNDFLSLDPLCRLKCEGRLWGGVYNRWWRGQQQRWAMQRQKERVCCEALGRNRSAVFFRQSSSVSFLSHTHSHSQGLFSPPVCFLSYCPRSIPAWSSQSHSSTRTHTHTHAHTQADLCSSP